MSEQAWRRRPAASRAASSAAPAASKPPPSASRVSGRVSLAMAPTAASSSKQTASRRPAGDGSEASRWRTLRQSVHVRAAVDASARPARSAHIGDLCEEDRDKVAQLVRRVVEIGTIHEESEAAFKHERAVLRGELDQLRAQAKRDATEIRELGDKLRSTLLSLRGHQARVLALEESGEAEMQARHEAEQTMDMLRAEVAKLRVLVRRQRDEMEAERRLEQERAQQEARELREQLRAAQAQLIQERKERITEKQRELDTRLQQQAETERLARGTEAPPRSEALVAEREEKTARRGDAVPTLDMSAFLNTSVELPETIRAIMDDWKERMEEALSGVASAAVAPTDSRTKSTGSEDSGVRSTLNPANASPTSRSQEPSTPAKPSAVVTKARTAAPTLVNDDSAPSSKESDACGSSSSDHGGTTEVLAVKRLDFDAYSSSASNSSAADESSGTSNGGHRSTNTQAESSRKSSHSRKSRSEMEHEQTVRSRADKSSRRRYSRHRRHQKQSATEAHGNRKHSTSNRQRRESHSAGSSEENWTSESERESRQQQSRRARRRSREANDDATEKNDLHSPNSDTRELPPDSSFGSMYETSLFEVVDAIESVRARDEDTRPRSHDFLYEMSKPPAVAPIPLGMAENGSRDRVERLKEHIEARGRKLARRNGVQEPARVTSSGRPHTQGSGSPQHIDDADSMDDFEVFNAVKDLYSREVFANGSPSGDRSLPTWKARLSGGDDDDSFVDADRDQSWLEYSHRIAGPAAGVPPRHSTQHKIREAVEDDIEALLRQEPLVHDLFLSA